MYVRISVRQGNYIYFSICYSNGRVFSSDKQNIVAYHQGRSQGRARRGGCPPPNHLTIHSFETFKTEQKVDGGGLEVKRDDTTTKLWIYHLHKAGKCILEAQEFSNFLGCYLTQPPPPKNQGSGYAPAYHIPFIITSPLC